MVNDIQPPAEARRNPALPDDIHAAGVDDICEPGLANDEAPKPFRFRGFIYPGSYLLSRDLSSDYHRRADVSLPGSEWDRVGPSGYDHQVSGSSFCFSAYPAIICSLVWVCCVAGRQTDIRVAFGIFCVSFGFTLAFLTSGIQQKLLVTGGEPFCVYKVYWMLVVLGSIHYCNYTCTLSTWSSSTLL